MKKFALACIALFLWIPFVAYGAEDTSSLTLTVTPPLFQLTQSPGTDWTSVIRVVNSNHYDLVVSATVMDFHPDGETGNPAFENSPVASPTDTHRMSGWIEVPSGMITVPRDKTVEIPFTVHVPKNADPGGHYASILIGTHSSDQIVGSGSGVSSSIGSLIFLRVPGDVVEEGDIRDFYAQSSFIDKNDDTFVLRFENKGNVHLVPQGNIVITNMWGKERGRIDINDSNTFGNVLPDSTRRFEFHWAGESNPFEFGRYTAIATLVYGTDGKKTVLRNAYFWVIPWKPVSIILGSLAFFVWFIAWSVRRYIRKALELERERVGGEIPAIENSPLVYTHKAATPPLTLTVLKRPLRVSQMSTSGTSSGLPVASRGVKEKVPLISILKRYRSVIGTLLVFVVGFSLIGWYFVEVFQDERMFKVEQVRPK